MYKWKKTKVILLSLFIVTLLSGCLDASMHVKVNWDGSGEYEVKVLAGEMILEQLEDMKQELQQKNYEVKTIEENNKTGWVAIKKVDNVLKDPPMEEFQKTTNSAIQWIESQMASASGNTNVQHQALKGLTDDYKIENSLFFTTVTINTEADLTDLMDQEEDKLDQQLSKWIMDQMNLKFMLTLPIKADKHNATTVSEDGKTLTWKLKPGEKNPIHLVLSIPNIITWGIIIGLSFIILLVISILLIIRRRKKKKNQVNNDPISNPYINPTDPKKSNDSFHWEDK